MLSNNAVDVILEVIDAGIAFAHTGTMLGCLEAVIPESLQLVKDFVEAVLLQLLGYRPESEAGKLKEIGSRLRSAEAAFFA